MAIISRIRKQSGLVLALIGLALVGFLVMDATTGRGSLFGNRQKTDVATVGGEAISINKFNDALTTLFPSNSGDNLPQNRAQTYNLLIEQTVMGREAEKLGIGCSATELNDATFGNQPNQFMFAFLQGIFNQQLTPELLNQFKEAVNKNQLNPELKPRWETTKELIKGDIVQEKLNTLIDKASYVPKWYAEVKANEQSQQIDLLFVRVPFDKIDDKDAPVTDADIDTYIQDNKSRFFSDEELRKIAFLPFDIIPSATDSAKAYTTMVNLVQEFSNTLNDTTFLAANGGDLKGSLTADELPEAVRAALTSAQTGTVVGPYFENKSYNAAKLLDRSSKPDSVQVRHILIGVNEQRDDATAKALADSLLAVVRANNGATFGELVTQYSDDQGSKMTGGEYTWSYKASLFPEYYDYAFKTGVRGAYDVVKTAQGGYHVINVVAYKGANVMAYSIGTLREPIAPSKETVGVVSSKAAQLLAQNRDITALEAAAKKEGLFLQTSPSVRGGDFVLGALGQGSTSRDIVRWAFSKEAKISQVAPQIFEYYDPADNYATRIVLAGLKSILPKGLPAAAVMREELEPLVRNRKKGALIAQQIKGSGVEAVASKYNMPIDTAVGVSFATSFSQKIGNEPKVIGVAFATALDKDSAPVVGESGVFVLKPVNKPEAAPVASIDIMQQQLKFNQRQSARQQISRAMRQAAGVDDYRNTFPSL
jgi:peptidyl-prolyl cis-trans isomerase D